jgi:CRISPR-associated exonuclease Cas4
MFSKNELLPLSALQHLLFCERQCALIYIEQLWNENLLTAKGRIMHDRVHSENRESRGNIRIEHGLHLRSLHLGLTGKADVVEFHYSDNNLESKEKYGKFWQPYPVEFKSGKPKSNNCDKVQLCAQAICLEEMLDVEVPEGAIFYGKTRHRQDVIFDDILRVQTLDAAYRVHKLIESGITPKPFYSAKCNNCSLIQICLPKIVMENRSVEKYLLEIFRNV